MEETLPNVRLVRSSESDIPPEQSEEENTFVEKADGASVIKKTSRPLLRRGALSDIASSSDLGGGLDGIDRGLKMVFKRLDAAISRGSMEDIKQILNLHEIDISVPFDKTQQTVLHTAAYAGHAHVVEFFIKLEKRPDINAKDSNGWTAFLCAASCGHLELCQYLLEQGADPKLFNNWRTTPLHYLLRKTFTGSQKQLYLSLLDTLIKAGIDVNMRNEPNGETALMQGAAKGNDEGVKFLLERGAKVEICNNKGETAVFYAENAGFTKLADLLKEHANGGKRRSLITYDVRLDDLPSIVNIMKNAEGGVPLSHHKTLFLTHRDTILGSEMVDWILRYLRMRTRAEAAELGQRLLTANYIVAVTGKKNQFTEGQVFKFASGQTTTNEEKITIRETTLTDFQPISVLGQGGFGLVLLVKKKDTGREYALKMIDRKKVENKPRDLRNLMREKAFLQNDCPFLVHLYYAFQSATHFYLFMDFIGGGDLAFHLKKVKTFTEKEIQFIACELILAISYLHSYGIVYRDLKPHNVLLDKEGHICLADFGLSREVLNSDANSYTACGTPSYSAPEVLKGQPYNKSVDWYSLGVVLFELLIGHVPHKFHGDFSSLVYEISHTEINFPKEISERTRSFLQALLQKDPSARLDDVEVMRRHAFFKGLNWDRMEVKSIPSPLKKYLKENPLENFESKFTGRELPRLEAELERQPINSKVRGFTFIS